MNNKRHIYLDEKNKDKFLSLENIFKRSTTDIVNTLFNNMSQDEIEDRMLKIINEEIKQKRKLNVKIDKE